MSPETTNSENVTLETIANAILAADSIGILTHRRPDGDAIGSTVAMSETIKALGKQVSIVNEDRVPDSLMFLGGIDGFQVASEVATPLEVDLILVLDAAGKDRVGENAWAAFSNSGPVINIDHHVSNTRFGDLNYVNSVSPATGQIVHELITKAGWTITEAARDSLYVAISTDTGSFRYPNTGAATYRIAADLIERGLDVGEVSRKLYESYPLRRVLLLRDLLRDMDLRENGRLVSIKLTRAMAEAVGMRDGDTEGLIDVIRSVDSVIVAVFFEEMEDGKIRVSSRSKSTRLDVGQVCAVFGGGGHQLAAGARMKGPLDAAAEKFLNEVATRLDGIN